MIYLFLFLIFTTSYTNVQGSTKTTIIRKNSQMAIEKPFCPICQEDITKNLWTSPCQGKHPYHKKCITGWFKIKRQCPLCKSNIPDMNRRLLHAVERHNFKEALACIPYVNRINVIKNSSGERLLHIAAKNPHDDDSIILLLLDHVAKVDATNDYGETALQEATRSDNTSIIGTLYYHGADVNHQSKTGDTAVHIAVLRLHDAALTALLFDCHAHTDIENKDHHTAQDIARAKK